MSTLELQHLKMAWIAAKEAGDTQAQYRLLRDHPEQQTALIDFIAAYQASAGSQQEEDDAALSLLTQRALNTALTRVFSEPAVLPATNLSELRSLRKMKKLEVARGLRLSADVWELFENGRIQLASLGQRQIDRLAQFFQVSAEQFGTLLNNSQPSMSMLRRQTLKAAQDEQQEQAEKTFADAVTQSTMSKEDKKYWLAK